MTDPQAAAPVDGDGAASSGWSSGPDSPAATSVHPGGIDHPVGTRDVPGRGPVIPGHVSIASRALQRVGGAVVAEQLLVDRRDVRVDARDDDGSLALRVSTPMTIPPLTAVPADQVGVVATITALQETLTRRMAEVTGRSVSRVDVSVTGSRLPLTNGRLS